MQAIQSAHAPPTPDGRPAGKPWSVQEAAKFSTLSERHLRRLIARGKLKTARFGRRVLIPDGEFRRLCTEGAD